MFGFLIPAKTCILSLKELAGASTFSVIVLGAVPAASEANRLLSLTELLAALVRPSEIVSKTNLTSLTVSALSKAVMVFTFCSVVRLLVLKSLLTYRSLALSRLVSESSFLRVLTVLELHLALPPCESLLLLLVLLTYTSFAARALSLAGAIFLSSFVSIIEPIPSAPSAAIVPAISSGATLVAYPRSNSLTASSSPSS